MSINDWYAERGAIQNTQPLQPLWKPMADKRKAVSGGKLRLSESQFIEWFQHTRPILESWCQPEFEESWSNLLWYTGDYLPRTDLIIRTEGGSEVRIPKQLAPLAINYMNHLTNKRVAELSIYKPTHDTQPEDETSNTERMTARVMKKLIERGKRVNKLDALFNEIEQANMINGFVYAAIDWNPRIGDKLKPRSIEREGQTEVKIRYAWHVLPWRCRQWSLVPCIIEIEDILHVEEARVRFNRPDLQPFGQVNLYSFQSPFIEQISPDEVVIYRTIYKPDEFLPNGAVVRSTHDEVLEMEVETYPWGHEDFPLERYTDINVPARFFPMSFYQNVKPMQQTYNNLSGLLKRYIFTLGHPKIIHERGSVNVKSLGNSPSLIGVKPTARISPSIMQVKSIGSDPFTFRAGLRDEMVAFSDTHKVGLGDLPPNTRSALMISRLREIENQQRGPQIDKRNSFMGRVLLKMGAVDAEHVPLTSKNHITRLVGKEMVQDVVDLKKVNVSSQYRCLIVNSSGFSAEMTGRIGEIAGIENEAKLPLTPQEKRDILGGVLREKHYDVLTAARFTCEAEIEMMNDGVNPPPPRITDDLITHWTTLSIEMQTMYHRRLPDKLQKMKEERLKQVEMLIEEVISKNPDTLFAERVKMLDGYPRVYNLTKEPEVPGQSVPAAQAPQGMAIPAQALPPAGQQAPAPIEG